ncbi:MAG: hypothetical protein AAF436_15565 [Myxococcota bacterium]
MSRSRKLLGCVRVALLGCGVTTFAVIILLGRARGAVDDSLVVLGGSLMAHSGASPEGHRTLTLNGNAIHFSVQTVDRSLQQVVGRRVADCNARDGELAESLTRLLAARIPVGRAHWPELRSVATTSFQDGGRGYVACLDLGEAQVTIPELMSRFHRFSGTGKLHALGGMRFLFAQSVADAPATTLVLTAWADELDLGALLSMKFAGRDQPAPLEFGSPPGALPILFANESGGSSALMVYVSKGATTQKLVDFYAQALPRLGYRWVGGTPGERPEVDSITILGAERDGEVVTLVVKPTSPESTTLILLRTDAS